MENNEFHPGDVVWLRASSPTMVVEAVGPCNMVLEGEYATAWFDVRGRLQRGVFVECVLTSTPPGCGDENCPHCGSGEEGEEYEADDEFDEEAN